MLLRRVSWILVAAALTACAGTVPAAAATLSSAATTISLINQNATVTPSSPGEPAQFTIGVAIHGPQPAGAQIALTFYNQLGSTGSFEQTLNNSPSGEVLHRVAAEPLSGLHLVDGAFQLTTTVAAGQASDTGPASVGLGLGGSCFNWPSRTCSGVYPVVVELQDTASNVVSRFTTYLTYTDSESTNPLVFSWVVPVGSPVRIDPKGPLSSALATPSQSRLGDIAQLLTTLSSNPGVQETLAPSPMTIEAMAASPTARAHDALAALRSFVATNPRRVLLQPYVPVDLSSLSAAGEPTEIKGQMTRATTVLATDIGVDANQILTNIWLSRGSVGPAITEGLNAVHAPTLVIPDTALPTATEEDHATWAQPFLLATGRGDVETAISDTQLTPYFTTAPEGGALAAYQLLANLAMIHFEIPGANDPRGIIAVPPADWNPNPAFVSALIGGLNGNPLVTTATLDQLFSQVPQAANGAGGTRKLTSGSDSQISASRAASITAARNQITGFSDAVQGQPPVANQLEDLLLASESSELSTREQRNGLSTFERDLDGELSEISVLASTITLTARTASLPITIVSSANYRLTATLTLSSAKLQFPEGATRTVTIDHPTNPTNVEVRALTTGDLPLSFALTSQDGLLVIATGRLTVRSTATSIWGIVLTLVAAAVLLGWWLRTWRRGRRSREARGVRGATP